MCCRCARWPKAGRTLTISLIATGYTLGFTISCIVTPKFVLRVGHVRVFAALITLLSIAILMCGLVVDWRAWILFRAISGFAISGSYLVIESWLNERVTNENRGMLFSLYLITTMVGTIGGQYLVPLGDPTEFVAVHSVWRAVFAGAPANGAILVRDARPAGTGQIRCAGALSPLAGRRRRRVSRRRNVRSLAQSRRRLHPEDRPFHRGGRNAAGCRCLLAAPSRRSRSGEPPTRWTGVSSWSAVASSASSLASPWSALVGSSPLVLYVIAAFVGSVLFRFMRSTSPMPTILPGPTNMSRFPPA